MGIKLWKAVWPQTRMQVVCTDLCCRQEEATLLQTHSAFEESAARPWAAHLECDDAGRSQQLAALHTHRLLQKLGFKKHPLTRDSCH